MPTPHKQTIKPAPPLEDLKKAEQATTRNADRPATAAEAILLAEAPDETHEASGAGDRPEAVMDAVRVADVPEARPSEPAKKRRRTDEASGHEAGEFPVPVYNPFVPSERFRVDGQGGWRPFVAGRYVARNEDELQAALNALRYHKRGVPEDFVGDDAREWTCREPACGFRSANAAAQDAHQLFAHK